MTWNHSTTSIPRCARGETRSARQRRADDRRRGILIAAVCPGLIDTGASRLWLDTTRAQTPAEAAAGLLDLALGPDPDPGFYGELVLAGKVVPWKPLG